MKMSYCKKWNTCAMWMGCRYFPIIPRMARKVTMVYGSKDILLFYFIFWRFCCWASCATAVTLICTKAGESDLCFQSGHIYIYPWSLTDSTIYFHDPVFPFIKTTSHDVVLLVPVLIATWWIVLWTNQLQHLGNKVCRLLFVSYTVSKLIVVQGGTNSEPETVSCVGSKCNVQQVHLTDNYSRKKMFKIRIRMRSLLIKCGVDFILHSVLYVFCKSDEGYILYQQ